MNLKSGKKLQRELQRLIYSYTKRSVHYCLARSPLTSLNTMHKYLLAFPWIATQCFYHWIMIPEHITHSLGKVMALLCLMGVPSTKDPTGDVPPTWVENQPLGMGMTPYKMQNLVYEWVTFSWKIGTCMDLLSNSMAAHPYQKQTWVPPGTCPRTSRRQLG